MERLKVVETFLAGIAQPWHASHLHAIR
jgi:hypothetical protein